MSGEENIGGDEAANNDQQSSLSASLQEWFEENILMWVIKDPWGFLRTLFMFLTPLFIISGVLSYILMKDIEKKEKDKKRKSKKDANTLRARGKPSKPKHRKAD